VRQRDEAEENEGGAGSRVTPTGNDQRGKETRCCWAVRGAILCCCVNTRYYPVRERERGGGEREWGEGREAEEQGGIAESSGGRKMKGKRERVHTTMRRGEMS